MKTLNIEIIKAKEFLTLRDVSKLLNCSIRTIYYLIENGKIKAVNLSQRKTLIKRSEIDILFSKPYIEPKPETVHYDFSDCYMLSEVRDKYGISDGGLHQLIKRHNIPKLLKWKCTYVPKQLIDNILNIVT